MSLGEKTKTLLFDVMYGIVCCWWASWMVFAVRNFLAGWGNLPVCFLMGQCAEVMRAGR